MKSLIEKIFKRESAFSYVIAEYKPGVKLGAKPVNAAEYAVEDRSKVDEMEIDNIYQKN